jgi:hypothetical protein
MNIGFSSTMRELVTVKLPKAVQALESHLGPNARNVTSTSGGYTGEKESLGDFANVCSMKAVPVETLQKGITINPGCVLVSDQDLSTMPPILPPEVTTVGLVTVCMRREAGPITLNAEKLSSLGMIKEGKSLISSIGNGDDTQTTVFKGDDAKGVVFKRYLGTPAADNGYTKINSLGANKYMADGSMIKGSVQSIELMTSIETLYDCADTLETADRRLARYQLAKALAREAATSK